MPAPLPSQLEEWQRYRPAPRYFRELIEGPAPAPAPAAESPESAAAAVSATDTHASAAPAVTARREGAAAASAVALPAVSSRRPRRRVAFEGAGDGRAGDRRAAEAEAEAEGADARSEDSVDAESDVFRDTDDEAQWAPQAAAAPGSRSQRSKQTGGSGSGSGRVQEQSQGQRASQSSLARQTGSDRLRRVCVRCFRCLLLAVFLSSTSGMTNWEFTVVCWRFVWSHFYSAALLSFFFLRSLCLLRALVRIRPRLQLQ